MSDPEPKFKRIMLKLSGEALMGKLDFGTDPDEVERIARQLGASAKTIDVHRARIKAKSEAESLAALVRDVLVLKVPLTPQGEGDQRPD